MKTSLRRPPHPLPLGVLILVLVGTAACSETGGNDDPATPAATPAGSAATPASARVQPGTAMGIYTPEQHRPYDGRFRIAGSRVHQVGTLSDRSPWDHMGDDAADVQAVEGTIEIDVDEIANDGVFRAALDLPEGRYEVAIDRFVELSPCQDGGIAAFLYEHGDAGCGDANWPKSLLYVAGWGLGHVTLDGEPLYQDHQIHFMVTQGMRDRETLRVFSRDDADGPAGAVNPAAQQLDFYVRSPEENPDNHPGREVFDHFFAMEVTWR
ncbi:MAG TPA: hypothetical protein VMT85_11375 [Thermoanaerobaculia bacterium]|nr:hypothetical protein [Thermoanaerobaculia bacterium]